ncbi:hypothetical protein KIH74_21810 [Kineosporia sp. J2-2]|uniref:Uncharacterized protein n=1 Tax=Kineosporia corallincola TaxID=2835133 RepID=A0ABS5TKG5_9ACTN|nr:hypothetical protein [Kineosporia corallincola]MBT0771590.1 hypothetical protein [Kineosporia corallincola]
MCRRHDPSANGEDDDPTAEEIAAGYHHARVHLHRPYLPSRHRNGDPDSDSDSDSDRAE